MNITITFTDKELDYLGNVLASRPYGEVASLLQNIHRQVQEQQASSLMGQHASPPAGLNGALPT